MSAFGDSGAGTLLKSLFYMTQAGQRYAQATNMIEGGRHRKSLEEQLRAALERQQAQETEQGQLTPYILDPERTETQPFAGTFRFPTTAKEYAALAEKGRERIGRRHAATALEPFSTPTLTGEDMGEVGTWPGAVRVTPGPAGLPPPPVESGSTGGPVRYERGAITERRVPPSPEAMLHFAKLSGAQREAAGSPLWSKTFVQEPGRTVQEGESAYTGEPPLMERRPGAPGPPTVDVLKPPRAGVGTVAEELRPPTFPEAYRRVPERYRELAVPYLVEKAKAGLFKDDAGKQASIGEAIVNSFVTTVRSRAAELREAGQVEEAALHDAEAERLANDADAKKNPQTAGISVRYAQQTLGRLKGPTLDKELSRKLVDLFGSQRQYRPEQLQEATRALTEDAGWATARKQWGLDDDLLNILRSKLGLEHPRDLTKQNVAEAREMREAEKVRVQGAGAGAAERARLEVPNPMTEPMSKKWSGLTDAMGMLDTMQGLLRSGQVNLPKIAGGIKPWVNAIVQEGKIGPIPVPEALLPTYTSEERQFLASLMDYADQVLRQRSGAQINEQEFKRMLTFLAHEGVRPEVILDRLKVQDSKLDREMGSLEHLLKSQRMLVPPRMPRERSAPAGLPTPPPGIGPPGLSPAKQKRLEELRQEKAREQGRP